MNFATVLLCATAIASAPPAPPTKVSFVETAGLVFIEVSVPGQDSVLALLDTGANATAVDPRIARHLPASDTSTVMGTTGPLSVENVRLTGLAVGGIALEELRATRRDLSGLLAPPGRTVGLILGSDALARFAVTIDFAERSIELSERALRGAPKGVHMKMDNGIPMIEARIGGVETWLRIDTGASLFETPDVYVNIPGRVWDDLRDRDADLAPTTSFKGTGADGQSVDLPVAPVPKARIGPRSFDRVFVIVQPEAGYFADPKARGFVSNNYLRRLGRVTLDFPAGRLR